MLRLGPDEIHLWYTACDDIQDDGLLASYMELLDSNEQRRVGVFRYNHLRQHYVITRAMVRIVLSRYFPIAPEQWSLPADENGRPFIANRLPPAESPFVFNISHTNDLISIAVTSRSELGVDVERMGARRWLDEISESYFAPQEIASLQALPFSERHELFFQYWTLKESYIKARGEGLKLPLDKINFSFHDEGIKLELDESLEDSPNLWQFWQLRPTSEHLAAVCVHRRGSHPATLIGRKLVPLVSENDMELDVFRTSAPLLSKSSSE